MRNGFILMPVLAMVSLLTLVMLGLREMVLTNLKDLGKFEKMSRAFYRAKNLIFQAEIKLQEGTLGKNEIVLVKELPSSLCDVAYYELMVFLQGKTCLVSRFTVAKKEEVACSLVEHWQYGRKALMTEKCYEKAS